MEERDLHTRYFHKMISWRRVKDSIRGIHIGSGWYEEPTRIKEEIRNKFMTRFSEHSKAKVLLNKIA